MDKLPTSQEFGLGLDLVADWQLDRIREQKLWDLWEDQFEESSPRYQMGDTEFLQHTTPTSGLFKSFHKHLTVVDQSCHIEWMCGEMGRTKDGFYLAMIVSWAPGSFVPDADELIDSHGFDEIPCEDAQPKCGSVFVSRTTPA